MKKINHLSVKQLFLIFTLLATSCLAYASVQDMEQLVTEQQFEEAYQLGNKLLVEEAGNPSFDMIYGIAASRLGKYDQALFAFERILIFDKTAAVARYEFALTHYLLGNFITARHHFNLVQETQPKPPLVILSRIQWYLATIDAKEAGKAIATSGSVNRFYAGARIGYDSNPRNLTHLDIYHPLFGLTPLNLPDVDTDTFHEFSVGANRLQQQTARWGWFVAGDASLRGYHEDQKNMDNYSLGAQIGGILLGSNWRLSLPLQVNKQARKDKNEVVVLALAANFNQRLSNKSDYSFFGQVADISFVPGDNSRDIKSYTLGLIYAYRINENFKLHAGPVLATEKPNSRTKQHNERNLLGLRSGMGYSFNNERRIDFNFSYLNAEHQANDPVFINQYRKEHQVNWGLKLSQRYPNNFLADFGVQRSSNDSTVDLYSYKRTQLSAGIRKEW